MKQAILTSFLVLTVLCCALPALAGSPTTLGGFTLGEDVKKYDADLRKDTAVPLRDAAFVTEVNINPDKIPGVRGGSLTYGNCKQPGKVLRIKIKFDDRSMSLFNTLLGLYTKQFGQPDNWEGDAFHNVVAWQWNFGGEKDRVSLLLMYSKVDELRPGVSIKMTQESMWRDEAQCYSTKHPEEDAPVDAPGSFDPRSFIPR